MDNFLPDNYEAPVSEGNYFKLKKGENTFRVVGSAIVGWEYWNKDNKPVRSKTELDPEDMVNAKTDKDDYPLPPKFFWAFPVYNYAVKKVQIMEITQKTIRESIEALIANKKWGNPKGYDITITATGDGFEREYTVMPEPHSESPVQNVPTIRLEALYKGEDPFAHETNTPDA